MRFAGRYAVRGLRGPGIIIDKAENRSVWFGVREGLGNRLELLRKRPYLYDAESTEDQ